MASGDPQFKRILNYKAGRTLWAELEDTEHIESSDEESYDFEKHEKTMHWMSIGNGSEVYIASIQDHSSEITTTVWTNESRAHEDIHLHEPSLFVTDIFRICKSSTLEETSLSASNEDGYEKVVMRVRKPVQFIMKREYKFLAKVKSGAHWKTCSLSFKDDKFLFRAKHLSSFFIFASPLDEHFNVFPSGTTFKPEFNKNVELVFPRDTVQKEELMTIKVWPTCEDQLSSVNQRGDEQCITAMSDTLIVEHKAKTLHHPIQITLPMHGDTEVKRGENVFFFTKKPDASDLDYEKLKHGEYSCDNGKVKVIRNIKKGRSHGVVKTKAKAVRIHEVLELSKVGYLCQFLYFKLSGGTESHFEIWIECARKYEVQDVRKRNIEQNMIEFPCSFSDDIPVHDQEQMVVHITGAVKRMGSKKTRRPLPVHMKFLAVSETTHARVALVKDQKIDGVYYADIDISFVWPRGRRSIRSQMDPWGRIMMVKEPHFRAPSLKQTSEVLGEKSLRALGTAIPPDKVEMLGVELDIPYAVIERLRLGSKGNIDIFAFHVLRNWKETPCSHHKCEQLVEALNELQLKNIADVVKDKSSRNERIRSSDFANY